MKPGRLAVLIVSLAATVAQADAPGVYAIRNGTVHPVSGPPIRNGIVVVRDGLIEAVGTNIAVPADASVIDAAGGHVYPGLFDAQTSLGITTPKTEGTERVSEPAADYDSAEHLEITDETLDTRRITGVTTVVTAPSYGIFNGQSVVLNLTADAGARVIKAPAAFQLAFRPRATWTYPDSLMGVIAFLRQTFLDAQHYASARAVYDRNPTGLRRPEANASLAALGGALRREVPVVFIADSAEMIGRAQALAREFNLRPIISGARQGYRMGTELRDVPTLVSVRWPVAPSNRIDREEQPLRVIRDRQLAPTTPSVLQKSGITFALVSAGATSSDFISGIRKAMENGLSEEDALRAVTLSPARIFGVDRQLGSLERGKIANVVVTDRPIFERRATVKTLLVDGRIVRPQAASESSTASPVNGTWSLTVRTPQGTVAVNVTLSAQAGHVSGTYSGDRGSGDIGGGIFADDTLQFTISAEVDAETSDWVFRGTVSNDTIQGTVTTTAGTFDFSGSKPE
jgi:imidazolonepropionase-like amidohydrolase